MQDGVELTAGARARNEAAAFHRRLAAEDVADVEPLGAVDIHRITDAGYLAAVGRQAAGNRQRGQAQIARDPYERQIVARRNGDKLAIDGLAAASGDDADLHHLVTQRVAHDMGVRHDLVRGDGEARAVADREQLAILFADDDDAHHAAGGRIDIGRIRMGHRRREEREQGGKEEWKASHRSRLVKIIGFDRKMRDASRGGLAHIGVPCAIGRLP